MEITLGNEFGAILQIGKGSIFEIPFGGKRYTREDFVGEITSLVGAVVASGFQEQVLTSEGEIVGASRKIKRTGTLTKDVSDSWRELGWSLFSKRKRENYSYEPFGRVGVGH